MFAPCLVLSCLSQFPSFFHSYAASLSEDMKHWNMFDTENQYLNTVTNEWYAEIVGNGTIFMIKLESFLSIPLCIDKIICISIMTF
jgi:hypothetical protein